MSCLYLRVPGLAILHRTINYLGNPLGRLAGLKHRQLARQVGVIVKIIGEFEGPSSTKSIYSKQIVGSNLNHGCLSATRRIQVRNRVKPEKSSSDRVWHLRCVAQSKSEPDVRASTRSRQNYHPQRQRTSHQAARSSHKTSRVLLGAYNKVHSSTTTPRTATASPSGRDGSTSTTRV